VTRGLFARRRRQRGQGLVEFALVLPIFLLLLLIMLEFGLAFNHNLTIGLATREGARTGAALASGDKTVNNCTGANAINSGDPLLVDQQVIAGVQRILKSPGSDVVMANISQIRIFKADANGVQIGGFVNVWNYTGVATGPTVDPGPPIDKLDFTQSTVAWPACSRLNGGIPDSMGVTVRYNYVLKTPLGSLMSALKGVVPNPIVMNDQTVMVLQPYSNS
jgi:hypothetical protein